MRTQGTVVLLALLAGCAPVSHTATRFTPAPTSAAAAPTSAAAAPTPAPSAAAAPAPAGTAVLSRSTAATGQPAPTASLPTPFPSDAYPSVSAALAAGAVPWADLPYHSPVDPDPLAHPTGTPSWCTAADLTIAAPGGSDGAGGFLFFDYVIRAKAGHRCSLQGYPVVHETDEGRTWSLTNEPPDTFAVPPGGILAEGHPGDAEVRWGHDVSGYGVDVARAPGIVTFDLPHHGGRVTIHDGSVGYAMPGGAVSSPPRHLGRLLVEPLHAPGPAVYTGLRAATISARLLPLRATVRAGSTLHYQLWLSPGTGAGRYAGPPCLGFRQRLLEDRTGTVIVSEDHALNCSGVTSLPSGGRVFDLELPVPVSTRLGDYELEWRSDIGSDYAIGSVGLPVTVLAADS